MKETSFFFQMIEVVLFACVLVVFVIYGAEQVYRKLRGMHAMTCPACKKDNLIPSTMGYYTTISTFTERIPGTTNTVRDMCTYAWMWSAKCIHCHQRLEETDMSRLSPPRQTGTRLVENCTACSGTALCQACHGWK